MENYQRYHGIIFIFQAMKRKSVILSLALGILLVFQTNVWSAEYQEGWKAFHEKNYEKAFKNGNLLLKKETQKHIPSGTPCITMGRV